MPEESEANLEPRESHASRLKKFISVHLKFNLSQSRVYREKSAVDNLKKAELHLSREKIIEENECHLDRTNCGPKLDERPTKSGPRFQRVHILQVTGYRDDKTPTTILHRTDIVDTRESAPLLIDITSIVKTWLMNPESNHGIIVRVTNDDRDEETNRRRRHTQTASSTEDATNKVNPTNASSTTASESAFELLDEKKEHSLNQVSEHIRLKRQFRGSSDDPRSWLMNQPSILIYSLDSTKKHVKRHHNDDDLDQMQADEPDSSPSSAQNDDEKTTQLSVGPISTTSTSTTTAATSTRPSITTSIYARRDQSPVARRGSSASRSSQGGSTSSGRSGSNQSSQKSKSKSKPSRLVERCSKKSLAINFDEVGWSNWIIAPQAYYANYCSGDCTWPHLDDVQNSTNHAIIQAIFNSVGRVVPKSCCVPVKLTEMAILYQLDGVVQMRVYGDMIVETCGCL